MRPSLPLTRRCILFAAPLAALPAWAAEPSNGRMAFAVFRKGERIGDHRMTFLRTAGATTVKTEAAMTFRIGPLKIDYAHEAEERWAGKEFQSLQTTSRTNGKTEQVSARRAAGGVVIEAGSSPRTVSADAAPLSHWNLDALRRPLFNPQTGKLLKATVSQTAAALPGAPPAPGVRWSVRGPGADIDDWYDAAGVWTGLRGRLPDGSLMEYRRV